jgi:hypothetical protein
LTGRAAGRTIDWIGSLRVEAAVSEHEHEQQSDKTSDETDETMQDLDVPEEDAEDVKAGMRKSGGDPGDIIAI